MRLWHYKLIPFLPDKQLRGQWNELNSIFKKQDYHILINFVYEYPKIHLYTFSLMVIAEMRKRRINIKQWSHFDAYFGTSDCLNEILNCEEIKIPFPRKNDRKYLIQCFYNLQEKYDCGQSDFTEKRYKQIRKIVFEELGADYFLEE